MFFKVIVFEADTIVDGHDTLEGGISFEGDPIKKLIIYWEVIVQLKVIIFER